MTNAKLLRLTIILVSVWLALVLSEVVLRVLNKPRPPLSGWKAVEVRPSELNQLGFRGQPILYGDDDFVIVLVGDSFVEAKACAYDWMPERRLQFYINRTGRKAKVFSVGASGYGQDQELLGLRDYFRRFRADLIVLWETPVNDVWNNVFPSSMPAAGTPKPTFWLENGRLRGPSEEIGQPIRENSGLKLIQLWRKNFRWSRDHLWEKNYPPAYQPMSEYAGEVKSDWQQLWDNNPEFREDVSSEKSHLAISLTPRSERMEYGLDLTHELIREMERLITSQGGRFVAFTHQTPPEESEGIRNDGVHALNGLYYRTSRGQYDENVSYINRGFTFLIVPVITEQWRVGPDNSHLNEHATDQVMKDLAQELEALIPIK